MMVALRWTFLLSAAALAAPLGMMAGALPDGASAARAAAPNPPRPAKRPNIVIIVADDLGWADVSTYGQRRVATPNIDSLAARGVAFSNGYAAAPVCSVSRAALLTGRYPQRFGNEYLTPGDTPATGLRLDQATMANYLKRAGYRTGVIGKWHEGTQPGYRPLERGFDEFYGFLGDLTTYQDPRNPMVVSAAVNGAPAPEPDRQGSRQIVTGPDYRPVNDFDRYSTDVFADRAKDFIQRNAANPFFLYLAFNAPHRPFQAPKAIYDRLGSIKDPARRIYVAQIMALDMAVGRVDDALKQAGVANDTLVVFTSDNGCPAQFGACDCSSLINAGKFTLLEGGTRVPFIVAWPKGIQRRGIVDTPVSLLDIAKTLVDAAGADADGLDGRDLVSTVAAPPSSRSLFWRARPIAAVRDGRWKLWRSADLKQVKLFDLMRDPGELRDLSAQRPAIVAKLTAKLDGWDGSLPDPSWPTRRVDTVKICGRETEEVW